VQGLGPRVQGGGCRVQGGGWRVEGGGWRVEREAGHYPVRVPDSQDPHAPPQARGDAAPPQFQYLRWGRVWS